MSSIRCHTVPQFYLKYFLPLDSSLFWIYDRKDSFFREQSPINTTVIGDYYLSSPDKEGKKDSRMEEFFSLLEGMVRPILDTWIADPSEWRDDDKSVVAMFLSFMHARSTRAIEAAKEIENAGIDYSIDKLKAVSKNTDKFKELYNRFCVSDEGKDWKITFEEFSQLMSDPLKYATVQVNEKYAIGDSLLTSETVYYVLMGMYWGIAHIGGDHFFITNDAPLNIFVQTDKDRAIFGGGISSPKAEISFPLSPKLCLRIMHKPIKRYYRAYADFVNEINKRTIYSAEQYVISPFRSNRIHKIVKEFAASYGKPKIDAELIKQKFKDDGVGDNL